VTIEPYFLAIVDSFSGAVLLLFHSSYVVQAMRELEIYDANKIFLAEFLGRLLALPCNYGFGYVLRSVPKSPRFPVFSSKLQYQMLALGLVVSVFDVFAGALMQVLLGILAVPFKHQKLSAKKSDKNIPD
jgi:hypothetical protein